MIVVLWPVCEVGAAPPNPAPAPSSVSGAIGSCVLDGTVEAGYKRAPLWFKEPILIAESNVQRRLVWSLIWTPNPDTKYTPGHPETLSSVRPLSFKCIV